MMGGNKILGLGLVFVVAAAVAFGASYFMRGGSGAELSMGTSQAQASETEKLWGVRCSNKDGTPVEEGQRGDYCEIFQRISVAETGQRVMELSMGYPQGKDNPASVVLTLPLGILLPAGVAVQVDDNSDSMQKAAVQHCDNGGCYAVLQVDRDGVGDFKAGKRLIVAFKDVKGKTLQMPVNLSGFTKAIGQL